MQPRSSKKPMNENFYKQIIEQSLYGYAYHKIILDEKGAPIDYEFIEVNEIFEKLTGLKRKNIINKRITDILPEIRKGDFDWVAFYGEVALGAADREFEQYSMQLKKHYQVKVFSPEKYYFVTIFTDITSQIFISDISRQFMEHTGKEINYQELSDNLLSISGAKYVSFNLFDENGTDFTTVAISGINSNIKKAVKLLGFELTGKKWKHDPVRAEKIKDKTITYFNRLQELTGDVVPKKIISLFERIFAVGQAAVVKIMKDDRLLGDFTLMMPAGQVLNYSSMVEIYSSQVGMFLAKKKTETKLRQATASLSEEKSRFETLANNVPALIYFKDRDFVFQSVNKALCDLVGTTMDMMVGKTDYDLFPKEMADAFREDDANIIERGLAVRDRVETLPGAEGKTLWVLTNKIPILDENGKIIGLVGITMDITALKKAEEELLIAKKEAESANMAKSNFLANMSHEIRTPLNAIIGFSELLESQVNNEEHKQYLRSVVSSGHSLLSIINDILDLSKIEAGKMILQPGPVNIKDVISEIEQIFSLKISQKKLDLIVEIEEDIPATVIIDEVRLRQVLFNLIGNAVKFTDEGFVALTVKKLYSKKDNSKIDLMLSIKDSGIGIPKESQDEIFKPFIQGKNLQSAKYGGTGLGLAITKRLINMMNGTIGFHSAAGKGTVFNITIRDVAVSSVFKDINEKEEEAGNIIFKNSKVLIADDIESNRFLLESNLKPKGLTTYQAVNGEQAYEIAKSVMPDLILMDLKMPLMDGYESLAKIRNDEDLKAVKVIAVTASVTKEDEEKIKRSGFDGFIKKPVKRSLLFEEIKKHIPYLLNKEEANTYKEDNDKIPINNDRESLIAIRDTISSNYLKRHESMKNRFIISEIADFADEMIIFGRENKIEAISNWGARVKSLSDSFDMEHLPKEFDSFTDLLKRIDQSIGK